MNFGLTPEQEMVVSTVRGFVETELYPLEAEVERSNTCRPRSRGAIRDKVIALGFYAAELSGGARRRRARHAHLHAARARARPHRLGAGGPFRRGPSNILMACEGEQRERYLLPAIRGEKIDALAMSEPDAGSDVRSMKMHGAARRRRLGAERHEAFHQPCRRRRISSSSSPPPARRRRAPGAKKRITGFLVDRGTPGFEIRPGYKSVSQPRLQQFHPDLRRMPAAGRAGARRGAIAAST